MRGAPGRDHQRSPIWRSSRRSGCTAEGLPEDQQPVKPVTYSVVKTALIGLTRYLATYWAGQGVRVNAISPGGVFNNQDEVFLSRIRPLIPLGRMAERNEYQAAMVFLLSDASSYMTGQNLIIDIMLVRNIMRGWVSAQHVTHQSHALNHGWRGGFTDATEKSTIKQDSMVFPHPGPLPKGEGADQEGGG